MATSTSGITSLARELARRAPTLIPAGLGCVIEGLIAVVFGVMSAFAIHPERAVVSVGTTVVMISYGVGLGLAGRGLWRTRGWARSFAVCGQLLHLPIAWSFGQDGNAATMFTAIALAVSSVGILVCIFWPSATRQFADPNGPAGQH